MKETSRHKQSGSSLIVVVSFMATLMVIVAIAAQYTTTINRAVQRANTREQAVTVADATLETLFTNWRAICSATPTTPLPTSSFIGVIPVPTALQFPTLPSVTKFANAGGSYTTSDEYDSSYTISNVKVVAVDATLNSLASVDTPPVPAVGLAQTGTAKTTSAIYNYIASADVTLPTLAGNTVAKVRRVFSKQQLSPWNWAIFYVDPLEIHPGPQFTVTGWVHTNSNLYTGHSSLWLANKVTYGSDWSIGFMPGDAQHSETPTSPHWLASLPPTHDQSQQPFGLDATATFSTTDTNPNNDSYHALIEPPVAGYPDPLTSQRYWNQAGVVIQVTDNPNPNQPGSDGVKGHDIVTIGTPNSDGTITALSPSSSLYTMFSGAITTNQMIQDNRERASMGLATLDVSKIENNASGLSPSYKSSGFNGIVYIYDNSASSTARHGIRLLNGSKIPSTGLTVVSKNPVYVQGDFNTGGSPPSNASPSDPTTPQASGYNRAPCSILTDAVNILSNSWNDANSFAGTSSRVASNTTVNAAIVSGIVATAPIGGDGSYSGGAENFPRFLEDWSGATLTYYGSMVELYKSQQSIGEWGRANVYAPPKRQWYFDTNFKTTPPPGSLMVFSYVKGRWYVL
jgi:hypothetical protein